MKYFTTLLVALALVSVTGLGSADTHQETQTASGTIFVGHPATAFTGGVSEMTGADGGLGGFDGQWVTLDKTATGSEAVSLTFSSELPLADLDVWFYDADFGFINFSKCAANGDNVPEACSAPEGAAFAVVDGFSGAEISFEFTYTYSTA